MSKKDVEHLIMSKQNNLDISICLEITLTISTKTKHFEHLNMSNKHFEHINMPNKNNALSISTCLKTKHIEHINMPNNKTLGTFKHV